ncbi:MAG: hypothetical protein ABSG78_24085 [Verrucomicrobiota bacterium]|jgi:hypothetical protein
MMNSNSFSFISWMRTARTGFAFAGAMAACCTSAYAYGGGAIVVDNDEWTLSDSGFGAEGAANGTAYARQAAAFLTGGSGPILIYSDNFGLAGADLFTALTGGGYAVTEDPGLSTPFTVASLSAYKAVFLAGDTLPAADSAVLQAYVNGGGGVYIAAGTGTIAGGAAGEAAQWNSFLNPFGLNLANSYNGIGGDIPVVSSSPVLAGVTQLFYDNGNTVSASGSAEVITYDGAEGLIGVYSSSSVPDDTSTLFLAGVSLALLAFGVKHSGLNSKAEPAK